MAIFPHYHTVTPPPPPPPPTHTHTHTNTLDIEQRQVSLLKIKITTPTIFDIFCFQHKHRYHVNPTPAYGRLVNQRGINDPLAQPVFPQYTLTSVLSVSRKQFATHFDKRMTYHENQTFTIALGSVMHVSIKQNYISSKYATNFAHHPTKQLVCLK